MASETAVRARLGALQEQVHAWSIENFGEDQSATYPFLGAHEELGELNTSVLKRAQGIDESEKYSQRSDVGAEAERDAVGDVVIYLADCCARAGLDLQFAIDGSYDRIDTDDFMSTIFAVDGALGVLSNKIADETGEPSEFSFIEHDIVPIARAVSGMMLFCEQRGYNFVACVEQAWKEVSGRDWTPYTVEF